MPAPVILNAYIAVLTSQSLKKYNGADILYFQQVPEISRDSLTTAYDSTDIPLRTQPVNIWSHTENRKITFSVKFIAWDDPDLDVKQPVNWLRSLQFPTSTPPKKAQDKFLYGTRSINNKSIGGLIRMKSQPPLVLFVVGDLIRFTGFVTNVDPQWETDAVEKNTLLPLSATVSVSLEAVYNQEMNLDRVREW